MILVYKAQVILALLFQAFDAVSVQLGIVYRLPANALIRQEVKKFVPCDLVVILTIALVNQSSQLRLIDALDSSLKLSCQIFLQNACIFGGAILGQMLWDWFEFREELLKLLKFFRCEIKRMEPLLGQMAQGLEFVLDLSQL